MGAAPPHWKRLQHGGQAEAREQSVPGVKRHHMRDAAGADLQHVELELLVRAGLTVSM